MTATAPVGVLAEPDGLAARLAFAVGSVNRRLRPDGQQLTHVTLSALASVVRAGAIRPGELARAEGIAAPGVTRIITDLERLRFVQRTVDPADGRAALVTATPAGVAAVHDARAARAARLTSMLERCTDDDRATLTAAVGILERALQRTAPAPAPAAGPPSESGNLRTDQDGLR